MIQRVFNDGTARDTQERSIAFGHDLRIIATIASRLGSLAPMSVMSDPEHERRYLTPIVDAKDYSDVLSWTPQGFGNRLAIEYGAAGLWKYARPRPRSPVSPHDL